MGTCRMRAIRVVVATGVKLGPPGCYGGYRGSPGPTGMTTGVLSSLSFLCVFLKVNSHYSLKFLITPFFFEWTSSVLIREKSLSKALRL